MPVVTNTEKNPGLVPHANALVRVRLVAALVGAGPGYVITGDYSILGEYSTRTDSGGNWSVALVANALISPANTYYVADITPNVGLPIRHEFSVPNGAGPYRVEDILADPPASLPDLHISDPIGAHAASSVSLAAITGLVADDVQDALAETATAVYLEGYTAGDGVTNDTIGFQAAVAAAEAIAVAGGSARVVGSSGKTYLLNTWTNTGTGYAYLILVKGDRVVVDINGATVKSTVAPPVGNGIAFWFSGAGKVGSPGNYSLGGTWYPVRPKVNITGSHQRGAMMITVTSGAAFAANDIVFIATGETLPGTNTLQPDAEINEVLSVDDNTLHLKYPLSKPYAPEYFISGTSGLTSTSVTANAAPYYVAKVTDCTLKDVGLINVRWDVPLAGCCAGAMQAIGVVFENFTGRIGISGTFVQYVRSSRQCRYRLDKVHPSINGSMVAGAASGANDGLIDDVHVYGPYPTMFHLHEGQTDFTVSNARMRTGTAEEDTYSGGVSIRARAYGTKILHSDIIGGTANAVCVVDSSCVAGGLIQGNSFYAPAASGDLSVQGTGWRVLDNEYTEAIIVGVGNTSDRNWQRP